MDILIKPYSNEYKQNVIEALKVLQEHEYQLSSNTRKPASGDLCIRYFNVMLNQVKSKNGAIFNAFIKEIFAGFIAYHMMEEDVIVETEGSNKYAYITDICVLKDFRSLGISQSLFNAIEQDLKNKGFKGKIRLNSLSNNEPASYAYKKAGFVPYEIVFEKEI